MPARVLVPAGIFPRLVAPSPAWPSWDSTHLSPTYFSNGLYNLNYPTVAVFRDLCAGWTMTRCTNTWHRCTEHHLAGAPLSTTGCCGPRCDRPCRARFKHRALQLDRRRSERGRDEEDVGQFFWMFSFPTNPFWGSWVIESAPFFWNCSSPNHPQIKGKHHECFLTSFR